MKRIGALLTGVALLQWLILPACPCQLRAMFPSADVTAVDGGGTPEAGPAIVDEHGPRERCCCSDTGLKPLHAAPSEVPVPGVPVALAAIVMPVAPEPVLAGDRLRASGADPPDGDTRRHLRLQVFLI